MDDPGRIKHDLANAVSIVLANLEAMTDGIVSATPERLEALAQSLRHAQTLIAKLPSQDEHLL